jgi:hypothetical protein
MKTLAITMFVLCVSLGHASTQELEWEDIPDCSTECSPLSIPVVTPLGDVRLISEGQPRLEVLVQRTGEVVAYMANLPGQDGEVDYQALALMAHPTEHIVYLDWSVRYLPVRLVGNLVSSSTVADEPDGPFSPGWAGCNCWSYAVSVGFVGADRIRYVRRERFFSL